MWFRKKQEEAPRETMTLSVRLTPLAWREQAMRQQSESEQIRELKRQNKSLRQRRFNSRHAQTSLQRAYLICRAERDSLRTKLKALTHSRVETSGYCTELAETEQVHLNGHAQTISGIVHELRSSR